MTYPDSPGYKEGSTSRAAALSMALVAETLRGRVMRELIGHELTPDEIAGRLGETVLAVRPRLTELDRMGLIERTGETRRNRSRRMACVYRMVTP